jgi:GAF domain-containing protein
MAEALSIQLGAALESARLYQDISLRANTELAISEISTKIGSSVNLRNILRTTVQELGRVLPETEIIIQLQGDQSIESH